MKNRKSPENSPLKPPPMIKKNAPNQGKDHPGPKRKQGMPPAPNPRPRRNLPLGKLPPGKAKISISINQESPRRNPPKTRRLLLMLRRKRPPPKRRPKRPRPRGITPLFS
jgi:hypothetical protein